MCSEHFVYFYVVTNDAVLDIPRKRDRLLWYNNNAISGQPAARFTDQEGGQLFENTRVEIGLRYWDNVATMTINDTVYAASLHDLNVPVGSAYLAIHVGAFQGYDHMEFTNEETNQAPCAGVHGFT